MATWVWRKHELLAVLQMCMMFVKEKAGKVWSAQETGLLIPGSDRKKAIQTDQKTDDGKASWRICEAAQRLDSEIHCTRLRDKDGNPVAGVPGRNWNDRGLFTGSWSHC